MSDASVTPEPSMDEILQKIQRIIAEDEQPADQPAAAPPRSAEILNLTEAVGDNGTVRYLNPVETAPEPEPPPAPRPPERRIEPVPKRPEPVNRGSGARQYRRLTIIRRRHQLRPVSPVDGLRRQRRVSGVSWIIACQRTVQRCWTRPIVLTTSSRANTRPGNAPAALPPIRAAASAPT